MKKERKKKHIISSFGNCKCSFPYKINNGKCAQILNSVLLPCECARAYWDMHQKIIIRYLIFSFPLNTLSMWVEDTSRPDLFLIQSCFWWSLFVTSDKIAVSASFYSLSSFLYHTSYLHLLMMFAPVHIHPIINLCWWEWSLYSPNQRASENSPSKSAVT